MYFELLFYLSCCWLWIDRNSYHVSGCFEHCKDTVLRCHPNFVGFVQTVSLSLYVAKPRYVSFLIYNVDLLLIVSDNGLQPCTCSRLIYQFLIEYQELFRGTDGWIENIVLRFLYLSTKITEIPAFLERTRIISFNILGLAGLESNLAKTPQKL
jgi:hypothetical protein